MIVNTNQLTLALFEVGEELSDPISFYQELIAFNDLLSDPEINAFFNLTYDSFESVEKELSALFSHEMVNYLKLLYEYKALAHLDNIIKSYRAHLVEHGYLNDIEIISAEEMTEAMKTSIIEKLEKRYPGLTEYSFKLDSSLLGGVLIRANDDIYDISIKNKLNQVVKHGGAQNGKTI